MALSGVRISWVIFCNICVFEWLARIFRFSSSIRSCSISFISETSFTAITMLFTLPSLWRSQTMNAKRNQS